MKRCTFGLLAVLATAATAQAQVLVSPPYFLPQNWTRGASANSSYQFWESFTSPEGPNAPNPVAPPNPFNPSGTANAFDTSGQSFVTSGGNIYSFSAPLDIDVVVPNPNLGAGWFTTVVLQTQILGTEIDPTSVRLTYDSTTVTPFNSEELYRLPLGSMGFQVGTWFQFTVPGNVSSYLIEFAAQGSSMSLDRISVDTFANFGSQIVEPLPSTVPEPASIALVSVFGAATWLCRRTTRRVMP